VVPLIVVEGSAEAMATALSEVRGAGFRVIEGWLAQRGAGRVVCTGTVTSAEDAAAALLAAVAGAGLVIHGRAKRDVLDRLCDDLRRFGRLDHRLGTGSSGPVLTADQHALIGLLLNGLTLGEAAAQLGLTRRTADRRIAAARRALGVSTTAEALTVVVRRGRSGC